MPESLQQSLPDQNAEPALQLAKVFSLPVHLHNNYVRWIGNQLQQQAGVHIVTLNAEMSMQAEQQAALAAVIRQAELVIPDGAGIVFYLWLRGKRVQRCPGIELAESVLQQLPHWSNQRAVQQSTQGLAAGESQAPPYTTFFYGGAPGVCETAAEVLKQRIPGLAIAGTQHGYISAAEEADFCQHLQHLQPNVVLVGLGVPRQELWIAAHRHLCPNAIWVGVGGSFDIWAGTKTRAPAWLRDNHLEWVYRLYQEPWRWKRMLALPQFAWRSLVHFRR